MENGKLADEKIEEYSEINKPFGLPMMSLSGYAHQGYSHPGPMGHDLYQYPQMPRYSEHCTDTTYFQNWVLNGHHPDIPVSPESYGMCTGSPNDFQPGMGYELYTTVGANGERIVKRRTSANKKERRRTQSINTAFASLRGCIPNVPSDTKLSKIKTLRLATSYISYLMDVLAKDDPKLEQEGFKAELSKKSDKKSSSHHHQQQQQQQQQTTTEKNISLKEESPVCLF